MGSTDFENLHITDYSESELDADFLHRNLYGFRYSPEEIAEKFFGDDVDEEDVLEAIRRCDLSPESDPVYLNRCYHREGFSIDEMVDEVFDGCRSEDEIWQLLMDYGIVDYTDEGILDYYYNERGYSTQEIATEVFQGEVVKETIRIWLNDHDLMPDVRDPSSKRVDQIHVYLENADPGDVGDPLPTAENNPRKAT